MKYIRMICVVSLLALILFVKPVLADDSTGFDASRTAQMVAANGDHVAPATVDPPVFEKRNVKKSYAYGSPVKVSNSITVGPQGGSIAAKEKRSFRVEISGPVEGLGFNLGFSLESEVTYTLHAKPNSTCYMACRCYYEIETGERVLFDRLTNKVVGGPQPYTVKIPQRVDYMLVYV